MDVYIDKLKRAALDWVVAKSLGHTLVRYHEHYRKVAESNGKASAVVDQHLTRVPDHHCYINEDGKMESIPSYSSEWALAGFYLDRADIDVQHDRDREFDPEELVERYVANCGEVTAYGSTRMEAGLRTMAISVLGPVWNVPDDLLANGYSVSLDDLLRLHGETVFSIDEAKVRLSEGDKVFVFHEMGGGPTLVENIEMLDSYVEDLVLVLPSEASLLLPQMSDGLVELTSVAHAEQVLADRLIAGTIRPGECFGRWAGTDSGRVYLAGRHPKDPASAVWSCPDQLGQNLYSGLASAYHARREHLLTALRIIPVAKTTTTRMFNMNFRQYVLPDVPVPMRPTVVLTAIEEAELDRSVDLQELAKRIDVDGKFIFLHATLRDETGSFFNPHQPELETFARLRVDPDLAAHIVELRNMCASMNVTQAHALASKLEWGTGDMDAKYKQFLLNDTNLVVTRDEFWFANSESCVAGRALTTPVPIDLMLQQVADHNRGLLIFPDESGFRELVEAALNEEMVHSGLQPAPNLVQVADSPTP